MKIAIIGTGYVGLPTGVGLAELGHQVCCIDREQSKIDLLQSGKTPLFEEGLDELLTKNLANGNLSFSTSMKEGVSGAEIVVIAVGTPPHPITKEADMKYLYAAAAELAECIENYVTVAIKSTVPVGTASSVEDIISKTNSAADFDVVSLPEFLREGFAVQDFFNPDRIVIGTNSERAKAVMQELYKPFEEKSTLLFVQNRSAEIIKYASNAFLSIKIHYINEMANFCEAVDANIEEVAKGMGLDSRIGNKFLNPGPGYGGSCFPKDTLALNYMARQNDIELSLIQTVIKGNAKRKEEMAARILAEVAGIENPQIAVLGLAFKSGTDDCRESPAVEIISELIKEKVNIVAYDPEAMDNAHALLGDNIKYAKNPYEAIENADIIAVLTEWDQFKELDLEKIAQSVKQKIIIDCRNLLDKEKALELGFVYKGIGR